ncbi:putative O-methyltransferase YrrM [Peribacillus deserti]|uniref:tRNA 5-hydroxyuridine methyltransferase n=1 Tax=Peribacillus deserti TaxID=673318 RepID=A0ABS2QFD7_9BACI|nr:O-methyltransferase [Peribacillus deserti]MBM7691863.1 putative O-methyltransferase YrrM [Peribacillus deserti]
MNDKVEEYLQSLIPNTSALFNQMEQFAAVHNVPIMDKLGMEALLQFLRLHQPSRILEVGAAIGYSALRMADALPGVRIVTLERDKERIAWAHKYIAAAEKQNAIRLIEGDALLTFDEVEKEGPFDAIFIDAAKGQYRKFFETYEPLLAQTGIIITDNVLFRGLVAAEEAQFEQRRIKSLVRKIKDFNEWLMSNPSYHTVILPIGDGVAISKKAVKRREA